MRNLSVYPLTNEEVLNWLDQQTIALRKSLTVGGTGEVIINHLRELVLSNPITTDTETTTTAKD